jgi:methionyl-tRNA formyltransferase
MPFMNKLRISFFGTASLACPSLETLASDPHFELVQVVTQPDRPAGRGLHPQPSPVKSLALRLGLPVAQPHRCRDASFLESFHASATELAVVVAYGQILPRSLLDLAPMGFINVHASLLPKYRGAAPIQWAILNGDSQTGVTIMRIDEGLDTGDILSTATTPILDTDNATSLHDRLAQIGARALLDTINDLRDGSAQPRPQPHAEASYARKITRQDSPLDWTAHARHLWNKVRALVPWPGTSTSLPSHGKPMLLKIWEAQPVPHPSGVPGEILSASTAGIDVACTQDALRLLTVQREGGRKMSAAEFLAGHPLQPGQRLG